MKLNNFSVRQYQAFPKEQSKLIVVLEAPKSAVTTHFRDNPVELSNELLRLTTIETDPRIIVPPGWRATGLAEYGYEMPKQTTPHTAQLTHFTAIFHLEEVPVEEVEPEPEEEEATPPVEEVKPKKGKAKAKPKEKNVEDELLELEKLK